VTAFIFVLIDHQICGGDRDIIYIEIYRSVARVGNVNFRLCNFAYEFIIS